MDSTTRKRIGLLTNTLLSSYQIALRDALERCVPRHDADLVVVVGRELQHPDVNEETQNVIFDWVSSASLDGIVVLTGVLVNYGGSGVVRRIIERVAPVPVVSVGVELAGVPSITVDNRAGMRKVVQHLIEEHGCRQIAYVSGPADNQEAGERLAGYRDALAAHGLTPNKELITHGRFTLPTGKAGMLALLERAQPFDAVAAANDYMALGAMDALRERGISVPGQVRVAGFDDSALARLAARPLTSVAQPVEAMAERAVEVLFSAIDGKSSERLTAFSPRVMLRHSCGCGHADQRSLTPPATPRQSGAQFVARSRESLVASLSEFGLGSGSWWQVRSTELVQALARELEGQPGAFASAMEDVLDDAASSGFSIENLRRSVLSLRRALESAGASGVPELERLWLGTLNLISESHGRAEGRATLDLLERFIDLRFAAQRLSVSLDPETIAAELGRALPGLGVSTACLSVLDEHDPERLRSLLITSDGQSVPIPRGTYPRTDLVPRYLSPGPSHSFLVMPLTFESDVYGVLAVDGAASPRICELLRTHVGTAIKLGALHRRVIEETAARERADQLQLEGEVAIARQLQTALSPKNPRVDSLEIAACIAPAKQVGGDYCDVIEVPGGAWLCIGDVTGHGLLSGLIMLMIQSMVTALARSRPDATPAELLALVNQGLTPNIRERLEKEEHATMLAVRFSRDGRLELAGSHDDPLIYRKRSGRGEFIPTEGVWVGILEDIRECTPNQELQLEPGDILVLYTDGIVEARNAHGVQLGRERLCALVEEHAPRGPQAIQTALFEAVSAWTPLIVDDLTCLIARYEPGFQASRVPPAP